MTAAWIAAGLAVWLLLSLPPAMLVGRMLRRARHGQTVTAAPVRSWEEKTHA